MLHTFEPGKHDKAIAELLSLERKSTFDVLAGLLDNVDVDIRCDAAEMLMRIDAKRGEPLIISLLLDSDPNVRWSVCGFLYDFGDKHATSGLVNVLLNDTEADIRFFAADALGRIGDHSAIPSLRQAVQFDQGKDGEGRRVGDAAAEAIKQIETRST
jgi:HEAT repeat protein